MGRKTEIRRKFEFEKLTSYCIHYIGNVGFASERELGTVLARVIGERELSQGIISQVIASIEGQITPSGLIVVLRREHKQPSVVVGVVSPERFSSRITYTGTVIVGTTPT